MLTVTPTTLRIMEKHIPADHPDWQKICERYDDQNGRRFFRGCMIAFVIEVAFCLAVYLIIHAWRLL